MQDKQLIKIAAQAIHLCDSYQGKVENWEMLDEESLELFESKIKPLINKMQEYIWWPQEVEEVRKANYDDEYDFDWKEELLDYIYNGSSY
jgi:hypothetical protein